MIIAATIALVQTDYKKVLAYSTISQLGMMMLGLGSLGWAAGLFHLITHAFFKALLFLSAGSIYHSVHTYDMPKLGGLLKKMPITSVCMLIATMAISGVPLLSGFNSKDAILSATMKFAYDTGHIPLFACAAFGSALTAFYMFRMWFLVFDGTSRSAHLEHASHSAHSDIFQNLVVDLDSEGRYLFINAVANQLRYPNSHTHYFGCALLNLFAEANSEAIQEQITR